MNTQLDFFSPFAKTIQDGDINKAVWYIFWIIITLFVIYSAILAYHWIKYSLERRAMKYTLAVYFGISAILIIILMLAVLKLA